LLRWRLAGDLPIHRALHDFPHLREPPASKGDASFASRAVQARFNAGEAEFELFVCRHDSPFF
jgi:hypothetical protein